MYVKNTRQAKITVNLCTIKKLGILRLSIRISSIPFRGSGFDWPCRFAYIADPAAADEWLQVPLPLHDFRKYPRDIETHSEDPLGLQLDSLAFRRISKPSTSRTSSTILSISLPFVWSTRMTSAYVVSWGTWNAISRRVTQSSINRGSSR